MNKTLKFSLAIAVQVVILLTMIGMRSYTLLTGEPILLKVRPVDPRSLFRGDYVRFNYDISELKLSEIPHVGDDFQKNDKLWISLSKNEKYWVAEKIFQTRHLAPDKTPLIAAVIKNIRIDRDYTVRYQWRDKEYTASKTGSFRSTRQEVFVIINPFHPDKPLYLRRFSSNGPYLGKVIQVAPSKIAGNLSVVYQYHAKNKEYENSLEINQVEEAKFRKGDTLMISCNFKYPGKVQQVKSAAIGEIIGFKSYQILNVKYGIENYFVYEGTAQRIEDLSRPGENNEVAVEIRVDRFGKSAISRILVNDKLLVVE